MKITKIKENSLAEQIGLSIGDSLLKINGKSVIDHLDYEFRIADKNITLDLQINGELNQVIVEKDYDDDLGVEFEEIEGPDIDLSAYELNYPYTENGTSFSMSIDVTNNGNSNLIILE